MDLLSLTRGLGCSIIPRSVVSVVPPGNGNRPASCLALRRGQILLKYVRQACVRRTDQLRVGSIVLCPPGMHVSRCRGEIVELQPFVLSLELSVIRGTVWLD